MSNKAQSYWTSSDSGHKLPPDARGQQQRRSALLHLISPFPRSVTNTPPQSSTVICCGNMAVLCFMKCHVQPRSSPLMHRNAAWLPPGSAKKTNKLRGTESCSRGRKVGFLHVLEPRLAKIPLSDQDLTAKKNKKKKLLAVALGCEISDSSRTFFFFGKCREEVDFLGRLIAEQTEPAGMEKQMRGVGRRNRFPKFTLSHKSFILKLQRRWKVFKAFIVLGVVVRSGITVAHH